MGRPREFNAEQALEQAMEVFWARGYEATSLQDLIGAMEISKSSFYEAFGSKRELFLSAIGHYIDTRTENVVKLLDEEDSGKAAIVNPSARFMPFEWMSCSAFCPGSMAVNLSSQ